MPVVVLKHRVLQRTVPGEGPAAQRGLPGLDPDQSLQHDVVFPAGAQVVGIGELAHPGGEQAAQPSAVLAVGRLQRVEGVGEPAPADLEDLQVVPPHRNSTAIVQASVPRLSVAGISSRRQVAGRHRFSRTVTARNPVSVAATAASSSSAQGRVAASVPAAAASNCRVASTGWRAHRQSAVSDHRSASTPAALR